MSEDWVSAAIIDDDDELEEVIVVAKPKRKVKSKAAIIELVEEPEPEQKKERKPRTTTASLKHCFNVNSTGYEIGIDEAGRGPMFGRVYAGAVILPKDTDNTLFDFSQMKDSKKFHSKAKIEKVAEYIKENAVAWAVEYEDEQVIDDINILQATQSAMHKAIKNILLQLNKQENITASYENILLLVDGNYFKPYSTLNKTKTKLETIKHLLVEGGDNKYCCIAAASILAKVERDRYIEELCLQNPELVEYYGIDSNKGYGSKKHLDGIKEHGITKWHRKTFGICKEYA
jgi:ribonuclease HII